MLLPQLPMAESICVSVDFTSAEDNPIQIFGTATFSDASYFVELQYRMTCRPPKN